MPEVLTSILENYKSKIKNPLIGTIISVWIFHNWRIVYALFNFDADSTLQTRITFIEDYFSNKCFAGDIFIVIFIAFVVLFVTFLLLAASRYLTDTYYKIYEPSIVIKLDKRAIFTNEEREKMQIKIGDLNLEKEKLQDLISRLESQISKKDNKYETLKEENDSQIEYSIKEIKTHQDNYNLLKIKNDQVTLLIEHFDGIIDKMSEKTKQSFSIFIIHKDSMIVNDFKKHETLKNDLIKLGVLSYHQNGTYKITDLGFYFIDYFTLILK
jgi:hypothetical protein